MSDRLTEIRERLDKATPGPWEYGTGDFCHETGWTIGHRVNHVLLYADFEADAALAAHAPEDIAWLLAERDHLAAKVARVEAEVSEHWSYMTSRSAKFGRTGSECVCGECRVMRVLLAEEPPDA